MASTAIFVDGGAAAEDEEHGHHLTCTMVVDVDAGQIHPSWSWRCVILQDGTASTAIFVSER